MGWYEIILFSTFQCDTSSPTKDGNGQISGDIGDAELADTTLLCNSNEDATGMSIVYSEAQNTATTSRQKRCSQNMGQVGSIDMSVIGRSITNRSLPENATVCHGMSKSLLLILSTEIMKINIFYLENMGAERFKRYLDWCYAKG